MEEFSDGVLERFLTKEVDEWVDAVVQGGQHGCELTHLHKGGEQVVVDYVRVEQGYWQSVTDESGSHYQQVASK